ncbi:uncharacterized protein RHO25_007018 [Cercospora beticola]|nr:hypothetical protein RHO25_007018 [Cercospora beticola]
MGVHPQIVGQVPDMKLEELYQPTMVSITVVDGDESETFHIPRELICTRSDYFRATFKGQFSESKSLTTTLEETPIWTFKTFVGWLYTCRLVLPQTPTGLLGETGEAKDPTTWPFQTLFELSSSRSPLETDTPSFLSEIAFLYGNVPRASPLIRFICYDAAENLDENEALRDYQKQIIAVLGDVEIAFDIASDYKAACEASKRRSPDCRGSAGLFDFGISCDAHSVPPYAANHCLQKWCFWHEHEKDENDSEKTICAHRVENFEERLEAQYEESGRSELWEDRKGAWRRSMFTLTPSRSVRDFFDYGWVNLPF